MSDPARAIVYFGTSDFAVPPLLALLGTGGKFRVAAVVTQPDRAAGRKQEVKPSPVARAARDRGLALFQPAALKDETFLGAMAGLKPDLFVVAAYGKILPPALLAVPPLGSLNLHGSLLPKYRGASPIQAAILAGEKEAGVSLMVMDADMDHGPVLATVAAPIGPNDTHGSLENRLAGLAARLLVENMDQFVQGTLRPQEQDHATATFTKIIDRQDGFIVWATEDASTIERKIRAYDPWPGVYAVWRRQGEPFRIKILAGRPLAATVPAGAAPGVVFVTENKTPAVATKAGALELLKIQVAGKKPASSEDFLRGHSDIVGATLEAQDKA